MVLRERNESIRVKEFYTIEFWLKLIIRIPATTTKGIISSLGYRCSDKYLRYTNLQ